MTAVQTDPYSTSFGDGVMFQVEVLADSGRCWVDMSEHKSLENAKAEIARLRQPVTSPTRWSGGVDHSKSKFRIRRFEVVEIIDVPDHDSGVPQ